MKFGKKLKKAGVALGLAGMLAGSGCHGSGKTAVRYDVYGNPHYVQRDGMNDGDKIALGGLALWGLGAKRNAPGGMALGDRIFNWGVNRSAAEAGKDEINIYNNQRFQPVRKPVRSKFEKIWMEHNVSIGGHKGMTINLDFSVYGVKDHNIRSAFYFFRADGRELKGNDGFLESGSGQVAMGGPIVRAPLESTAVRGQKIFFPYKQLEIEEGGRHELKFRAELWDYSRDPPVSLGVSPFVRFNITY